MVQHYDIAVLGSEISGLIAALLMAREGRRVALVEMRPASVAPSDAADLPLSPLSDVSAIARVHDALGLVQPLGARTSGRVALQLIAGPHRVDVGGSRTELGRELGRCFPAMAAPIDDFLQRLAQHERAVTQFLAQAPPLPPETLGQRLALWRQGRPHSALGRPADAATLDALFGAVPVGHPLREMCSAAAQLLGEGGAEPPSLFVWVHRVAQTLWGGRPPASTLSALRVMLLEAADRAGVARIARPNTPVLTSHRREISALAEDPGDAVLRAQVYLYNDTAPLACLWPQGGAEQLRADAAPCPQVGRWAQWRWRVPRADLPGPLAPMALVAGQVPIRLQWAPGQQADGELGVHEPHVQVTATVAISHAQASRFAQAAEALEAAVVPQLQRLAPHARALAKLPLGQVLAQPRYGAPPTSTFGAGGRTRRTGAKNLFYVGPDVAPGLDLEGAYVAALGAAICMRQRGGWRP